MAHKESIKIPAHHNIYNGFNERELRIDFSIPSKGTNEKTGIFIFSPGFGGHIDSNVYKKMRNDFADQLNMVTIQCNYFGSEFMQDVDEIIINLQHFEGKLSESDFSALKNNPTNVINIISKYEEHFLVNAQIDENENYFNDMGYMQAIDILTAIEAVKIILKENNLKFNDLNVIGYGQSHGAFLLHLANVLAPHLFSKIIDNAAWVKPVYLTNPRSLYKSINQSLLNIIFNYKAINFIKDKQALSLHTLYEGFNNEAYIYSCLGTTDNLVEVEDKGDVFRNIKFVDYEVIDSTKVDGTIFKSTNHGLDADFLELINYVFDKTPEHINNSIQRQKYSMQFSNTKIDVDYSKGLPIFNIQGLR